MNFRRSEGAARFAARRQREIDAPRLHEAVPKLATLRLEVEEIGGAGTALESKHVRHVVVANAPALFVVVCADSSCKDGGHDITSSMMSHLQRSDDEFVVEDECNGSVGSAPCRRLIRVRARASYQ